MLMLKPRGTSSPMHPLAPACFRFAAAFGLMTVVIGCAPTPKSVYDTQAHDPRVDRRIPEATAVVSEGKGKIGFVAPGEGYVYLYDLTNDGVVYSFPAKTNDRIELSVVTDSKATTRPTLQILVNDATIFSKDGDPSVSHRFYFEPGRTRR
jgi:hypothetical protein